MKTKGGAIERIVIPELEAAAKEYNPRGWTKDEEEVVRAYWGRVTPQALAKHLKRHSAEAIRAKAKRMVELA